MCARSKKDTPRDGAPRLPLLSDLAIPKDDCTADHFGLEYKLGAIIDAIFLRETETPFSAMFTGGWGVGKTSAMSWLDARLKGGPKGYGRRKTVRVQTCWFYPWKYQSTEDVWRGLVAEVILASIQTGAADAAKVVKAARQFGSFLGSGFVRVLSAVKLKIGDNKVIGFSADVDSRDAFSGVIEEYGKHIKPHEPYFNEFEELLRRWVTDAYPLKGSQRLVIFIDDLDRCMPDIALQVLEALKLYLNVPNLIFVIGVDRAVVDRIVDKRYADLVGEEAMAAGFEDKAARYLDKMFPIEINIEPTDAEVQSFFENRIESTSIWQSVPKEYRDLLKRVLLDLSEGNPRTIIRLVNRVVVAFGRHYGGDELALAQEMQQELLDVVCQKLGYELLPQRQAAGRDFFAAWSNILRCSPDKAIYMPRVEIELRLARRGGDEANSEVRGASGRRARRGDRASIVSKVARARPEFDHLAPMLASEFSGYERILGNLHAARLLSIPYPNDPYEVNSQQALALASSHYASLVDRARLLIAHTNGVDPTDLTDSDVYATQFLNISDSEVQDLSPLSVLINLEQLNLSNCIATDISPIGRLTRLQYLVLFASSISDISPISELINLIHLDIDGSDVEDITSLADLRNLRVFSCGHTAVCNIEALSNMKALQQFSAYDCNISDIEPIRQCSSLEQLDLSNTAVVDVSPLESLSGLQYLSLHTTAISNITALANLTSLNRLSLGNTRVKNFAPLSSLRELRELDLSYTAFEDVSILRDHINLRILNLLRTNVLDYSMLDQLPLLEYVILPNGEEYKKET